MDVLNLNAIIESTGVDHADLADALFPKNKEPRQALYRVMRRDAYLNEEQISKLANFIGCTVPELYTKGEDLQYKDGKVFIDMGEISAILDPDTMKLQIRKKSEVIHDTVIMKTTITVAELIEYIKTVYNN